MTTIYILARLDRDKPAHDACQWLHETAGARLWCRPCGSNPSKAKGWRAGWAASRVTLRLSGSTATRPGRRLEGDELEQAKRRLMQQYSGAANERQSPLHHETSAAAPSGAFSWPGESRAYMPARAGFQRTIDQAIKQAPMTIAKQHRGQTPRRERKSFRTWTVSQLLERCDPRQVLIDLAAMPTEDLMEKAGCSYLDAPPRDAASALEAVLPSICARSNPFPSTCA